MLPKHLADDHWDTGDVRDQRRYASGVRHTERAQGCAVVCKRKRTFEYMIRCYLEDAPRRADRTDAESTSQVGDTRSWCL